MGIPLVRKKINRTPEGNARVAQAARARHQKDRENKVYWDLGKEYPKAQYWATYFGLHPEALLGHVLKDGSDYWRNQYDNPRLKKQIPIDIKEDGTPIWGRKTNGNPICGKVSFRQKADGEKFLEICPHSNNLQDDGRCRFHSREHSRMAKGTYRKDQFGKIFQENFDEKLKRILADPSLQTLEIELAVADERLKARLGTLEGSDTTAKHWRYVADYAEELLLLLNPEGKYDAELLGEINSRIKEICDKILAARDENEKWDEIERAVKMRERLVTAEANRKKAAESTFTAQQMTQFVQAVTKAIGVHVRDRMTRALVFQDIDKIFALPKDAEVIDAEFEEVVEEVRE